MEVKVEVRLNGIEEKLEQLGPKLAKSHLRKALKEAALIWETEAKAKVPVDSGDLRESIATVVKMSPKQDRGSASVGAEYDKTALKSGDSTSQSPGVYGMFLEFGTKKMPARPWLRPVFDGQSDKVLDKFIEVLKDGLDQVTP